MGPAASQLENPQGLTPPSPHTHFVLLTSLIGGKVGTSPNTEHLSGKEFLLQALWTETSSSPMSTREARALDEDVPREERALGMQSSPHQQSCPSEGAKIHKGEVFRIRTLELYYWV